MRKTIDGNVFPRIHSKRPPISMSMPPKKKYAPLVVFRELVQCQRRYQDSHARCAAAASTSPAHEVHGEGEQRYEKSYEATAKPIS